MFQFNDAYFENKQLVQPCLVVEVDSFGDSLM